ncbi:MAG TPA: MGMT family protein [Candidatus Dormibacteraeota bacterium]
MKATELEQRLRQLGDERAPSSLLAGVLAATAPPSRYVELPTEIGPVFVVVGEAGISSVSLDRPAQPATPTPELREKLRRALEGKPVALEFDLRGLTPFEHDVLMKALEIPRGEIRTYGWIAREIGRPKAVRAVGTALANNPIPLFIPCHRVVRADGKIGNYGCGGPANKRRLLLFEGVPEAALGRTLAS